MVRKIVAMDLGKVDVDREKVPVDSESRRAAIYLKKVVVDREVVPWTCKKSPWTFKIFSKFCMIVIVKINNRSFTATERSDQRAHGFFLNVTNNTMWITHICLLNISPHNLVLSV